MNKKFKIVVFILMCLVFIGGIKAWLMWNKPHEDVMNADAVRTSAADLYNSFVKNPAEAKTTYANKVVEVSGEITQVSQNQQNKTVLLLKTDVPDASINCTMEGNTDGIKPGNLVHIKGICNGYNSGDADMGILGDVLLVRCYKIN